jgi:hypothetical protein
MESISGDQRSDQRYDIRLKVRYRLSRGSRVLYEGTGATTNLSSGGVAFTTERFLPSGLSIRLWIEWPILRHGRHPVELQIAGRILRCHDGKVTVRTNWHEFVHLGSPAFESESLLVA